MASAARQAGELMGVREEVPRKAGKGMATFEGLVEALIRPSRAEYAFSDLGPTDGSVIVGGSVKRRIRRDDWTLTNGRGLKLHGSWWRVGKNREDHKQPPGRILVYLHANASSRVEALRAGVLRAAIQCDADLVAFDFAGSGWSDGLYVSLGYFERYDVVDVVAYVVGACEQRAMKTGVKFEPPEVVLWGRSMGATTALLYAALPGTYSNIKGLILDSAFRSVRGIVEDLVRRGKYRLPKLAARAILALLRKTTTERTGGAKVVDVDVTQPLSGVDAREWLALGAVRRAPLHDDASMVMRAAAWTTPHVRCDSKSACDASAKPALALGGRFDDFIPPEIHMDKICEIYAGDAISVRFDGSHNSPRPAWVRDAAATFAHGLFNQDYARALDTVAVLSSAQMPDGASESYLADLRALVAAERVLANLVDELLVIGLSLELAQGDGDAYLADLASCACDLALNTFGLNHWHASPLFDDIRAFSETPADNASSPLPN